MSNVSEIPNELLSQPRPHKTTQVIISIRFSHCQLDTLRILNIPSISLHGIYQMRFSNAALMHQMHLSKLGQNMHSLMSHEVKSSLCANRAWTICSWASCIMPAFNFNIFIVLLSHRTTNQAAIAHVNVNDNNWRSKRCMFQLEYSMYWFIFETCQMSNRHSNRWVMAW